MERFLETVKLPNQPQVVAWYCAKCGNADSAFSSEYPFQRKDLWRKSGAFNIRMGVRTR
jgi:hypothetical protein